MATVYRTYRLDEPTRKAMKKRRQRDGQTVAAFLDAAVSNHLPEIVDELVAVGVPPELAEQARPSRLPMSDALVDKLKLGSKRTGVSNNSAIDRCDSSSR